MCEKVRQITKQEWTIIICYLLKDTIIRTGVKQTFPARIAKRVTTSSSVQFIRKVSLKTNTTGKLPKLEKQSLIISDKFYNTRNKLKKKRHTSASASDTKWTRGLSNKPTACRTFSSSANHSSWTLLTHLKKNTHKMMLSILRTVKKKK